MNELEKIYNNIRGENKNFKDMVENGDIFIPIEILRNKDLNTNEKLYIATYYGFNKDVNKTDHYMKINKLKTAKIKKHLLKLGYLKIKKMDIKLLKETTIKKSHKGKKCEWCGNKCYILQQHHYPISAKKGGKTTVNICPNCHYTFHKLEGEIYE